MTIEAGLPPFYAVLLGSEEVAGVIPQPAPGLPAFYRLLLHDDSYQAPARSAGSSLGGASSSLASATSSVHGRLSATGVGPASAVCSASPAGSALRGGRLSATASALLGPGGAVIGRVTSGFPPFFSMALPRDVDQEGALRGAAAAFSADAFLAASGRLVAGGRTSAQAAATLGAAGGLSSRSSSGFPPFFALSLPQDLYQAPAISPQAGASFLAEAFLAASASVILQPVVSTDAPGVPPFLVAILRKKQRTSTAYPFVPAVAGLPPFFGALFLADEEGAERPAPGRVGGSCLFLPSATFSAACAALRSGRASTGASLSLSGVGITRSLIIRVLQVVEAVGYVRLTLDGDGNLTMAHEEVG